MGDIRNLELDIAAVQQARREDGVKYAVHHVLKLQCLVDSSIGDASIGDAVSIGDSSIGGALPTPLVEDACPTPLLEDLFTPESITNLLPHDTNLLPHDGQLIIDALVVLEPLPTNRKATAFGIEEDFRCISEDEAVKSNDMADLFHRSTTYTAQKRKLAATQDVDKQKSLAVLSNYVRVLEQDLGATKLRLETQNRLEKCPLAWLDHLTKFWVRSHHSNAGENINAVFAAHCMGYWRLVRAGVAPANDPEVHEQALESVGYYEGEPGICSLPYGIIYKVNRGTPLCKVNIGTPVIDWFVQGGVFDGRPEGFGTHLHVTATTKQSRFEGYHLGNKRCGIEQRSNTIRFSGSFLDDKYSGQGIRSYGSGDRYDGNWVDGKPSGQGIRYYASGDRYDGNWLHGKKSGQGIYYYASGDRYEGNWLDGKKSGQGIYHYAASCCT